MRERERERDCWTRWWKWWWWRIERRNSDVGSSLIDRERVNELSISRSVGSQSPTPPWEHFVLHVPFMSINTYIKKTIIGPQCFSSVLQRHSLINSNSLLCVSLSAGRSVCLLFVNAFEHLTLYLNRMVYRIITYKTIAAMQRQFVIAFQRSINSSTYSFRKYKYMKSHSWWLACKLAFIGWGVGVISVSLCV